MRANIDFVLPNLATGGDLHHDDDIAGRQLLDLVEQGVTHIVDCRIEADDTDFVAALDPDMAYLHIGVDDDGGRMPASWFAEGTAWIAEAMSDPDAVVFVHCHMGINRGPSMAFAAMLTLGYDPIEAITAIRTARPIAAVGYAEEALGWHLHGSGATNTERRTQRAALRRWRTNNPHDTVRIIRQIRRGEQPIAS